MKQNALDPIEGLYCDLLFIYTMIHSEAALLGGQTINSLNKYFLAFVCLIFKKNRNPKYSINRILKINCS